MTRIASGLDRRKGSWLAAWSFWVLATLLFGIPLASAKTQADYYVKSLPGQPDGPLLKMHAGYVVTRT